MKRLACAVLGCLAISCGGSTIDDIASLDGGRDAKIERPDAGLDAKREPDAVLGSDVGAGGRLDASFDVAIDPPIEPAIDAADVTLDPSADVAFDGRADVGPDHDSSCAIDCATLPNVQPSAPVECKGGQCFVPPGWCVPGFAHCSSRPEDGCEADLSQSTSCGACDFVCSPGFRCAPVGNGHGCVLDCGTLDNCLGACVDLSNDPSHCGTCNEDCAADNPHSTVSCDHSQCKIVSCDEGYGDCNEEPGCETKLDSADNCGACGKKACSFANATAPCAATGCGEPSCNAGFANCDKTSLDCETPITATGATCWPRYLGTVAIGGDPSRATSAAILADGTHFIGGDFGRIADFDPGPGLDLRTPAGGSDAFVAKFGGDGTLAWAKTFGGTEPDGVAALAAGPDGSVIAAGFYAGTVDLDPGPGVDSHTADSGQETFVMKLDADGSLVWARTFSVLSSGYSDPLAVAVGADGSVYVGGEFSGSIDLDPGPAVVEKDADNLSGFLVKLTSSGSFVWGRAFGGPDCHSATLSGLALDGDGAPWTAGRMSGACPVDAADPDQTEPQQERVFVAGFTASGDYRRSWRFFPNGDLPALAVGSDSGIYVGGIFESSVDFDPGPNATTRMPPIASDGIGGVGGYVTKFGQDGTFRWVMTYPALLVSSIVAGPDGVLASCMRTNLEEHLIFGAGILQVDSAGTSIFSATIGGDQTVPGAIAASGARFVVTGQTDGLADFDPGPGVDIVDRGSVNFVSRYSF
jgi:hypothetical protein